MRTGNWRLFLGTIWLLAAVGLLLRDMFVPEDILGRFRERNLTFGAWMAVVLAGWNFARWYHTRPRYAVRNPLTPRREETAPYEYIPELDFQKMEREEVEKTESPPRHGDTEKH